MEAVVKDHKRVHSGRNISGLSSILQELKQDRHTKSLQYLISQDMLINGEHYVDLSHLLITIFDSLYLNDHIRRDLEITIEQF